MANSVGAGPGVLQDPGPAQVVDTVMVAPRFAADDALDDIALNVLLARALLERGEQKERSRGREEEKEDEAYGVWLT